MFSVSADIHIFWSLEAVQAPPYICIKLDVSSRLVLDDVRMFYRIVLLVNCQTMLSCSKAIYQNGYIINKYCYKTFKLLVFLFNFSTVNRHI